MTGYGIKTVSWYATRSAALAGLVLLFFSGCAEEEPPKKSIVRPVKAIKVTDSSEIGRRKFPGRAKATQELELSFRVDGPLIARPVDVGSVVKEGDVVARIDPRDYEVNLRNVEGQLDESKAALARAQSEYERELRIFQRDPGATSETAVVRKREQRDVAKANIKSLEASVAGAKDQLNYTYLKAPFDGTVVATYVENFETVRAKQPVIRLLDDSRIEIVIQIPETMISLVPYATDLQVEFDPFPGRPIPAEIKEIGTEASATTRTYPVTLIMDQPEDIKILPGMAGTATGKASNEIEFTRIEIPVAATFSPDETGKTYVWVIDDATMTVHRREVQVGELTSLGISIVAGLERGEWIATAGVNFLKEGQQVKILDQEDT